MVILMLLYNTCSLLLLNMGLYCVFSSPVRFVTLAPGDVFLTGTPPGVGVFRKPPIFLKVISQVQPTKKKEKKSRASLHKFLCP